MTANDWNLTLQFHKVSLTSPEQGNDSERLLSRFLWT